MAHIRLGTEVEDTISGFKGKVTQRTEFLHGCSRVWVQPPCGADGKLPEGQAFSELQLKPTGGVDAWEPDQEPHRLMGKKVKDTITKFAGTVTAVTYYMDAVNRLSIQPEELFEGKTVPSENFDEPQIQAFESVPAAPGGTRFPGGPGKSVAQAGMTPR